MADELFDSRLRQRRDEIVRLAETAAARVGCTCPLIYERGGWPHDPECLRGILHGTLVTTLVWWDHYLAWERRDREALALAEIVATRLPPGEDLGARPARSEAAYQRWKAGLA